MLTFDQLQPGCFYIPVFERIEPKGAEFHEKYRVDSPLYQYLGNGQFATEDGNAVEYFYDPELGANVVVDAADGFVQ